MERVKVDAQSFEELKCHPELSFCILNRIRAIVPRSADGRRAKRIGAVATERVPIHDAESVSQSVSQLVNPSVSQ